MKITDEMVERAARAMCERDGFRWDAANVMETANGDEPEQQREYWLDKADAALAAALAVQTQQGVGQSPSPDLQGHSAADIVKRIAEVSTVTGAMAGEPAIELAGQIISVLAAYPEHIDRFMAEGSELFIDGTFNPEHGSMTYRATNGSILSPSVLREKKGQQQ